MNPRVWLCCVAGVAVLGLLAGCGSGTAPGNEPLQPMGRIVEYVGDGGGSLKPWPASLPAKSGMNTQAVGALLTSGAAAIQSNVPTKYTNWFSLPVRNVATTFIVTLQPTADEDSDLYLLQSSDYGDGAGVLNYSNRAPSGGADPAGGFAPDWVPYDASPTGGYPAAQVAVFGNTTGPSPKHFRIESDIPRDLTVNGPAVTTSVPRYQSKWYRYFWTGGGYTVTVTPASGDPDFYVYREVATWYLGGQVGPGGGSVPLDAFVPAPRYIRVYGFSDTTYTIQLTAP